MTTGKHNTYIAKITFTFHPVYNPSHWSPGPAGPPLPLTCTVQEVGAFTIACRLLCLRRFAEIARKAA